MRGNFSGSRLIGQDLHWIEARNLSSDLVRYSMNFFFRFAKSLGKGVLGVSCFVLTGSFVHDFSLQKRPQVELLKVWFSQLLSLSFIFS